MKIRRLSDVNEDFSNVPGEVLVMVGSYAPVHAGHTDVMESAFRVLRERGRTVLASVFVPNSDSYVLDVKLANQGKNWGFERRVEGFLRVDVDVPVPVFVDDVTGANAPEKTISEVAIDTISKRLGVAAREMVLVVGSDQITSMKPHLDANRAVCVIRPGIDEYALNQVLAWDWLAEAVRDGRYLLTGRKLIHNISSTDIRAKNGLTKDCDD